MTTSAVRDSITSAFESLGLASPAATTTSKDEVKVSSTEAISLEEQFTLDHQETQVGVGREVTRKVDEDEGEDGGQASAW
ncbi:hypothetical protein JCM10213v2_004733 [Rhodosporidiobolus nylandii]